MIIVVLAMPLFVGLGGRQCYETLSLLLKYLTGLVFVNEFSYSNKFSPAV